MAHNILVVDDDSSVLHTVRKILENAGLSVDTVTNGDDCIHKLQDGFKGLICIGLYSKTFRLYKICRYYSRISLISKLIV